MKFKAPVFHILLITIFCTIFSSTSLDLLSQVQLRDTSVLWQHHRFELNEDHSMKDYTTIDTDIQEISFTNGKVIENDLIRLVILPEYGARVISFFYKPTQHEYLYQSECGSPYGIGDGNFYYNWLMVYGGIFPTFPEPEHGKTWFLPWDFSVISTNADTVTIRMEYTDNTSFAAAPSIFNNGITNLTCQVDVSVYSNSAIWDFDVRIINNRAEKVNYEYWTCTTLTPGSDPGNTRAPLNSEIIIPAEEYIAGWSPGSWIGNFNGKYDMENLDFLNEWNNMGIAYAHNLADIYWGVINHDNEEGIFRISDNVNTKGMKLWTWGRDNVDNDMFDFSNGGADNYIELWGGVSNQFFQDAVINENEQINWKESYCATVGLSDISYINDKAGVNIIWDENNEMLSYELNTFHSDRNYRLEIYMDEANRIDIGEDNIEFQPEATTNSFLLKGLNLASGEYTVYFDLIDEEENLCLRSSKVLNIGTTSNVSALKAKDNDLKVINLGNQIMRIAMNKMDSYRFQIFNSGGQLISNGHFSDTTIDLQMPLSGLYIVRIFDGKSVLAKKVVL